ncbi:pyridoxal-phosphate dependent enzyme [bacterium]|nr:pyridoxal-phosphate dependent enzyme [bacterium]
MNERIDKPILFRYFPGLSGKIAWIQLADLPTPVQRLHHLDHEDLWIKRDDLTSRLYGGNKVRKLEFALADAKRKNKKRVITFGGIGTNHGLATAVFCRQLEMDCLLLLFKQPITEHVKKNLLLFHAFGAETIYKGSLTGTVLDYYLSRRLKNPFDYYLFAGGSSLTGIIGFVNAAFELKSQVEQGQIPEPAVLICPVGSNGTLAGLSLGVQLAGMKTRLIGVRVTASHLGPIQSCTPDVAFGLMKKTYRFLKKRCEAIPELHLKKPEFIENYFGQGYGHPTREGINAYLELKNKENITLDPCYTSKTFAAVLNFCCQQPKGPILYWHTYNSVDLSDKAQGVDTTMLPQDIRQFLEEKEIDCESFTPFTHREDMKDKFTTGTPAPDFSFDSPWQKNLQFHKILDEKPAFLIFLRYIGCPVCQLKIAELKKDYAEFEQKNVQILVVLQSLPENIQELTTEKEMPFTIVCDPGEKIFSQYKVTPGNLLQYAPPSVVIKAVKAKMKGFKHGKSEGKEMQLPAVFFVDKEKTIQYAYYGKNIGDVPANTDLLKAIG